MRIPGKLEILGGQMSRTHTPPTAKQDRTSRDADASEVETRRIPIRIALGKFQAGLSRGDQEGKFRCLSRSPSPHFRSYVARRA